MPDPKSAMVRDTITSPNSWAEEPKATILIKSQLSSTPQEIGGGRVTILPRIDMSSGEPTLIHEAKIRYQSLKILGRGGAGEVSLERDQDIDRPVAVKRLLPHLNDPATLARFAEEVRTVGSLEHPNIIPVHDVGVDEEGRHFFTMKYIKGETLEDIIEKLRSGDPEYHKRFSFEQRTQIFLGILHAIEYAHVNGIIHRDIKPANIMVGPYGEVIVMDWGIAKRIKTGSLDLSDPALFSQAPPNEPPAEPKSRRELFATKQGGLIGTPAYMSPEQVKGEKNIDERSDIYSLSVLFYELLTLSHYLEGKRSLVEMLAGVINQAPTPAVLVPSEHQEPVPAELAHFLAKGMAKDPAQRYQSAREMIEKLQQNLAGEIQVQCTSTLAKKVAYNFIHFVDDHPFLVRSLMFAAPFVSLVLLGLFVFSLLY